MDRCFIRLAGCEIEITYPAGLKFRTDNYDKFIGTYSSGPDGRIDVVREPIEPRWLGRWNEGDFDYDGKLWAYSRTGDRKWPHLFGPSPAVPADPPMPFVLADSSFGRLRVHLEYETPAIDKGYFYPMDEIVAKHFFAHRNAIIVHASGIHIDGKGYLFLGDSGAGKSTIAGLFEERVGLNQIYSDDRIVLRKVAGEWWMFGSPWHGTSERTSALGAPLGGLCFIEKASYSKLTPLSLNESSTRFLPVGFFTWWLQSTLDLQFSLVDDLLRDERVSKWRLDFPLNPSVVSHFYDSALSHALD